MRKRIRWMTRFRFIALSSCSVTAVPPHERLCLRDRSSGFLPVRREIRVALAANWLKLGELFQHFFRHVWKYVDEGEAIKQVWSSFTVSFRFYFMSFHDVITPETNKTGTVLSNFYFLFQNVIPALITERRSTTTVVWWIGQFTTVFWVNAQLTIQMYRYSAAWRFQFCVH